MNNLNRILDKALQYMETSETFLNKEVPEFCKQLMEYHAWDTQMSYDITFWLALFFFVVSVAFLLRAITCSDGGEAGACVWGMVMCGIVFLISFFMCVSNYKDLKMYKIAPKVFLIKTIKDMAVRE